MAMPAVPGGGQHRAILAGVQAVRPRCAPGAAPGHRLRVTHAQTRPGTPEKRAQRLNAALTDPALSGMTNIGASNGLLRQYFPKGTDLSRYNPEQLAAVAHTLNTRPRKVLDWKTPAEALHKVLYSRP